MPNPLQLLKQLRGAVTSMERSAATPEQKALLGAMGCILNELVQQERPTFYLDYIRRGMLMLDEGRQLAARSAGVAVAPLQEEEGIDARSRIGLVHERIDALHRRLCEVVNALDEGRSAAEKAFLVRLADWDTGLYEHRLAAAQESPALPAMRITADAFEGYLRRRFPERAGLRLLAFEPLAGGFSKSTILVETEDASAGRQAMVIRAEQPVNLLWFEGSDVTREFPMIQLMRRCGVPVAEPLWLEADAGQLGARFIVSRKARGQTLGGNFGSEDALPAELLQSLMDTFIHLHGIRPDAEDPLVRASHLAEWLPHATVSAVTRHYVSEFLPRLVRLTGITLSPQLQRGLSWLARNVPDCDEAPVIVHIDFALNNLIIDGNRVSAVLDWESSRLGDPAEDIIWTQQNLARHISMAEFLRWYREGTGRDVSAYRLAYARVAKCALNAITCSSAMRALDTHDDAHIILAPLGYRYMALFGTQFNALIAEAESLRGT